MAGTLVTGANGFIGSHLVEALLDRDEEVTAFVRDPARAESLVERGARLAQGDVTNVESLRQAVAGKSVVYHLAGRTKAFRARQFYEANRRGVRNVARVCAEQSDPPVLVVVSSLAAAGPATADRFREEADRPQPVSWYGRSKRAGERAAAHFADRVPITVVRPPIVFGEADRMSLEIFKTIARAGVHLVPGYTPRKYSMIHADDLVSALILAAERGARVGSGRQDDGTAAGVGFYFVAGDEHPSWYEFGRMIGQALGRRHTLTIPFGTPVVRAVGAFGELTGRLRGEQPAMNLDKAREATAGSWICSAGKAKRELGFSVAAGLPDRLLQTVRWYRNEGWL